MPPDQPGQRDAEIPRPSFTLNEAYARLAHTLFERLPDVLLAEPNSLTPRSLAATLRELRDQLGETRDHLRSISTPDLRDQVELRTLARDLMQQFSELLRSPKVRDITVVDLDDDWPIVRKRRAPLSDWDIWTLHTALMMLRRSYAMVTHAEAYAAAHHPRPPRPPRSQNGPRGPERRYTPRAFGKPTGGSQWATP